MDLREISSELLYLWQDIAKYLLHNQARIVKQIICSSSLYVQGALTLEHSDQNNSYLSFYWMHFDVFYME